MPGDLVVIGAGVAAGRGDLEPAVALVAIVVASILGGIIQYGLLRSVARPALVRLLTRLGSAERVDRQTDRFRQRGVRSVAVARSTPGVRIVAIAASALAGVPAPAFVGGLAIRNCLFISAHFALGFVVGERIVSAVGGALGPLAIAAVGLAVIGAIGWVILSRRRGRRAARLPDVAAWADTCCPVCLVGAAVDSRLAP